MNSDIRVSTTFFFHRKIKKLGQSLKDHGILCLLKLWTRVAVEKPCGILAGWDVEDIEIEADFTGERGGFVKELLRLGLLDEKDGVYILHNWDERQGWVSKSEERGNKARLSRMAKTHKDIYDKLVNDGYKSLTRKEYDSLTTEQRIVNESLTTINGALTPAPSPSPSPSPSPKDKRFMSDSIEYRLAEYLFKHILKNNPKYKQPNLQLWAKSIDLMIRIDKREPEEIKQIIRWCQHDNFWHTNILSASKLREKYDTLFLKMQEYNPRTGSFQTDANLRAAKAFLEGDEDE